MIVDQVGDATRRFDPYVDTPAQDVDVSGFPAAPPIRESRAS